MRLKVQIHYFACSYPILSYPIHSILSILCYLVSMPLAFSLLFTTPSLQPEESFQMLICPCNIFCVQSHALQWPMWSGSANLSKHSLHLSDHTSCSPSLKHGPISPTCWSLFIMPFPSYSVS